MIISPGRKFIFVHIPKTGGTSMAVALEQRAMADDILIGDTPKAKRRRKRLDKLRAKGRLWKHTTLADIDGVLSASELEPYFIFTLVRNPWDRLVSYYAWLRAQSFQHPAVALAKKSDFAAFLCDPATQASFRAGPFASYLRDAEGNERADLFIRLEHFDEDVIPLEQHLGFCLHPLLHENRSVRTADYRTHYTEELAELVANFCAVDISRFGYRFG